MDFDKSKFVENSQYLVYSDIDKMISIISGSMNIKLNVQSIIALLTELRSNNVKINKEICYRILNEIDLISIRYIESEIPPLPNWLKPVKV
jgi:hypothetical protein